MEPMDVQLHDDLEPEPSLVDLNESLDDANPRSVPQKHWRLSWTLTSWLIIVLADGKETSIGNVTGRFFMPGESMRPKTLEISE
ncbi:hypothetical protein DPMN_069607 [Dreissena polymorpha]|uniref:Uncharacterized protein n=1 Tax=Dreissena polymorpha TaxID=45954 RepID=A0A9D3Z1T4_DREPO|nr:hypothetical protein DPMN_069607 [Dreissena polymorpha]